MTSGNASRRALVLVSVAAVIVAGASVAIAGTNPAYSIAISDDDIVDLIDVPATTYTAEGETVEVTQFARTGQEGILRYAVEAPSGESYTVKIVDSEGTLVETTAGTGDDTFETYPENYQVGTYVIAVTNESGDQREVNAAEPFVVRGYTVTQDAESTVEPDGTLRVDVTIAPEGSPPEFTSVTVTVGDDSTRVVQNATRINETAYYAEFDAYQFDEGEYTVVSGVRGEVGFDGTAREYYGVSDTSTVEVTSDAGTATATATEDGSGGSTGGGSSAGSTTATETATPTTATGTTTAGTPAANETEDPNGTVTPTDTATADGSTATTTPGPTTGPTTTAANADDTSTTEQTGDKSSERGDDGTTETTGALFHPLGFLLVFGISLAALRYHSP
ncbi:hypothetical protein [Halobaculum roseum]|uniref:PGF-CTERM protein n=1 Tax=Halobaculum roseum TaxID=2175149 RepID=A0ABD5MRY5_9EURY|nr:hypothetical protein [Halobaculum roseum]QZY03452.1 hypothetical protein K6T36_04585 [Halobaculum roseum]